MRNDDAPIGYLLTRREAVALLGATGLVLLALPASAALLVALRHLRAAYADSPLYRDE